MSASIKRISAIFIKELQDIRTNMNQLFMYILPFLLTFLYKNFIPHMPKGMALSLGLLMLNILVGLMLPAMMIAEEKEKKTLEVLLLSPATPVEVFCGKGLLTYLSLMVSTLFLMVIDGESWNHTPAILIGTTLAAVFCIFFGMLVGLVAQNQMATGVVSFPFMMVFLMIPLFAIMGLDIMVKISTYIPTYYYLTMLRAATESSRPLSAMLPQIAILTGSIMVSFLLLLLVYKKKGLE